MVQDEALAVNKITRETLETAPPLKLVWEQFQNYVNQYNNKGNKWGAVIRCGYNNTKFDDIIIDRIAGGNNRHLKLINENLIANIKSTICGIKDSEINNEYVDQLCKLSKRFTSENEPYGWGPWEKECTLFHPRDSVDLMKILFLFTENLPEIRSLSFDSMREWLGLSKEGAHDAKTDVLQGAQVLVRFLKYIRKCASSAKFQGSFK